MLSLLLGMVRVLRNLDQVIPLFMSFDVFKYPLVTKAGLFLYLIIDYN